MPSRDKLRGALEHYYSQSGGAAFDEDYQAVLDRATSFGYTLPSSEQQTLQNDLVLALKTAGIWDSLDVFYVFATNGDSNFATINWIDPSDYQITKVNSPGFHANEGFEGNGSTSYLTTNWSPGLNGIKYTQTDASIFAADLVNIGGTGQLFGCSTTDNVTNSTRTNPRNNSNNFSYQINDSVTHSVSDVNDSTGLIQLQRVGNTKTAYKNGTSIHSTSQASAELPNNAMTILAINANSGPGSFRPSRVGVFGAGAALSGKESALHTAWNDYFTSL